MGLIPGQTYIVMSNNGKDIKGEYPIESLGKNSHRKVKVVCDICGTEKEICYDSYCKNIERHGLYVCKECFLHKDNFMDERNKKSRNTCIAKYGRENPSQVKEFQDKRKETCLERFGCEYAFQNPEILQKASNTMQERYGISWAMQSKDIQMKAQETCKINYGVNHPLQNPDLLKKAREMAFDNGYDIKCSNQQIAIYNIISKYYPNVELNYSEGRYDLDICLVINDIKIDIECDGYYWHYVIKPDQPQKDRVRDEINKRKGYKILRIIYKENIPNEDEIIAGIERLLNTDRMYTKVLSDDVKDFFK